MMELEAEKVAVEVAAVLEIEEVREKTITVLFTQWARKIKKVQAKKLVKPKESIFFREIAFLNFFLFSSKIVFWPFLKLQKMEFD